MKKFLIAVVLGLLLVAAWATTAAADNGPHGGFTATTDACASCHRAHSAQYGSNALLVADPEALCLSCHDGTGAGTNVEDGVYMQSGSDAFMGAANAAVEGTDGRSLFGGGFTNALMATVWSGQTSYNAAFNAASAATTSAHDMGTSGTIWGSGANNTVAGSMVLECTTCHDPHGNAGWDTTVTPAVRTTSYRLLRWQPNGSNGFTAPTVNVNWSGGAFPTNGTTTGWRVPDNFATNHQEWYTIGTTAAFADGDYNAGNANNVYNVKNPLVATGSYIPAAVNTAFFCAQCHDRYFNNSRLRNNTDISAYCGKPTSSTSTVVVPIVDDADLAAPWIHPTDPVRCEPVVDASNNLTGWGDNGASGDTVYMYRHASGDIRASMDGTVTAGAGTSVSRSCVACHVAHGTSATMTASAQAASFANDSALLRMDNRTICLRCHANTVNFTVAP